MHYLLISPYRSNEVHWISVVRTCIYDDAEYKTKNKPDILGLQSAIENTEIVNKKTLKKLAKEYSFTSGKWMLYGKTGSEIDGLWKINRIWNLIAGTWWMYIN